MDNGQMLTEIREANLTYLTLAQKMIRIDRAQAALQLGVSAESADLLALLSPAQVLKIATGNMLLCRFRVDDDLVWNLLTDHRPPAPQFANRAADLRKPAASGLLADVI
jgi:flagellar transcriptional activator FlhD